MGLLVEGKWQSDAGRWADSKGRMQRPDSTLRNWITPDGSPGPTGRGGFKAEAGRYHLYIARACPWAHRAAIFRELKGLQDMIGLSVTHWLMLENGWTFDPAPGVIPDTVNDARFAYELYAKSEPGYSGRVTVPVLWDKTDIAHREQRIRRHHPHAEQRVRWHRRDNPATTIRRNCAARSTRSTSASTTRSTTASTRPASRAARTRTTRPWSPVFETLDWLEEKLSRAEYLVGNRLTEADWRLFTTLLRFDPVYHTHFKCNLKRLVDYPALWALHAPALSASRRCGRR